MLQEQDYSQTAKIRHFNISNFGTINLNSRIFCLIAFLCKFILSLKTSCKHMMRKITLHLCFTTREVQAMLSLVPGSKIQMVSSGHPSAINCGQSTTYFLWQVQKKLPGRWLKLYVHHLGQRSELQKDILNPQAERWQFKPCNWMK